MSPAEFDFRSTMRPTRTKPRLLKARKHLNGRSSRTAVSGEPTSGFNPFRPVVEDPGKVSSSNVVNCSGFVFGAGFKLEGLGPLNGTFVFGVNSERRVGEVREVENGKVEGSSFVFGGGAGSDSRRVPGVSDGDAVTGAELKKRLDGRKDDQGVEVPGGCDAKFVFGTSWLDSKMRELNINGGTKESPSKDDDDHVFVFERTGNVHASSVGDSDDFGDDGKNGHGSFRAQEEDGSHDIGGVTSGSESFVFKAEQGSSSEVQSQGHVEDEIKGSVAASSKQSVDLGFDATYDACPPANLDRVENGSRGSTSPDGLGATFTEFQAPQWDPSCLKESLFPELHKTLNSDVKSESRTDKRVKKLRRKLKQPPIHKQRQGQGDLQNVSDINSPCYSPMDFSPYRETTASEQFSEESPLASNLNHLDKVDTQLGTHPTGSAFLKDEEGLTHGKNNVNSGQREEISGLYNERCSARGDSLNEPVFVAEMSFSDFNYEQHPEGVGENAATGENANSVRMESNQPLQFCFTSGSIDADGGKFSFSTSSSAKFPSTRRFRRKNHRRHVLSKTSVIAPRSNAKEEVGNSGKFEIGNVSEFGKQEHVVNTPSADELQETCETWRLRGNRAFKNGDVSKAEEFYSYGIDTAASCEASGYYLKPLVICYSNRAAARMSLGNMRDAICDCEKAAILDPNFLKVQLRAANCHLLLGEVEKALNHFNKCLESRAGVCLDRRITIEAANGLQKAQKVAESITSAAKLLEEKTPDVALSGLKITKEALSISPLSERLLEMKAWFLFSLCQYDEVIQLCERTLGAAEKNFASIGSDEHSVHVTHPQSTSYSFARLWRWHLISKSYFYTGRLEKALDMLEKLKQSSPLSPFTKEVSTELESATSIAVTIQDLLNHKNAGNAAVQSGRYADAVEHYTNAISNNLESRPFAAICFCNRAAGYQALGRIADAIADCSVAIALNKNYAKALSRRAALYEMIRDYEQAAIDLQRFISIIENQGDKKDGESGIAGQSTGTKELKQAQRRLRSIEEESKNGISLDLYLILGVKESDSASDVKKAYRKAALRHHPDKASQYLARCENGHEGQIWKEILQEVHVDADRLFKVIGEAYSVLSDPSKRQQYDLDEEIRKVTKQKDKSSHWKKASESHDFPFERSYRRRNSRDNWKTYGHYYGDSRW